MAWRRLPPVAWSGGRAGCGPAGPAAEEGSVSEGCSTDVSPRVDSGGCPAGRVQARDRTACQVQDLAVEGGAEATGGEYAEAGVGHRAAVRARDSLARAHVDSAERRLQRP